MVLDRVLEAGIDRKTIICPRWWSGSDLADWSPPLLCGASILWHYPPVFWRKLISSVEVKLGSIRLTVKNQLALSPAEIGFGRCDYARFTSSQRNASWVRRSGQIWIDI